MKIRIVNEDGHPVTTKLYNEKGEKLTHVTALHLDMTRDYIRCEMEVMMPTMDVWAEIPTHDVEAKLRAIRFWRKYMDELEAELLAGAQVA